MKRFIFLSLKFLFITSFLNFCLYPTNEEESPRVLTLDEKELLNQERVTNLIIVNDIQEVGIKKGACTVFLHKSLKSQEIVLCTKAIFWNVKEMHPESLDFYNNYICKEINAHFILLIPKHKMYEHKNLEMQDLMLGLSYTKFNDYRYFAGVSHKNLLYMEYIQVNKESNLLTIDNQSYFLLDALKKVQIEGYSRELLPFFNIFLSGHGSQGVIAEIYIKSKHKNELSDFLKVMTFFNNSLRTKSVFLSSCFIGGKQILDTYGEYDKNGKPVFDKLSNQILESLSYTIINKASQYVVTWFSDKMNISTYFELINASMPNYEEILKLFRLHNIENYISIKLPYTSWFVPVELKNETQSLSQVAMSTKTDSVDIKKTTKIIILGANYIPQSVDINSDVIPTLMPVNYYNQSYYFKSLRISSLSKDLDIFKVLKSLIFDHLKSLEEINFLFEEIQINAKIYKNVHCFSNNKKPFKTPIVSGFIYENTNGNTVEYNWSPSLDVKRIQSIKDEKIKAIKLDTKTWEIEFKNISKNIEQNISKSLQVDYIEKLSKQIQPNSKSFHILNLINKTLTQGFILNKEEIENLSEFIFYYKDLLKIDDLLLILEKGITEKEPLVHSNYKQLLINLLKKNFFPEKFKQILPIIEKGLSDSDAQITETILSLIKELSHNNLINKENIDQIILIIKKEIHNPSLSVQGNNITIFQDLIDEKIIAEKNIDNWLLLFIKENMTNFDIYNGLNFNNLIAWLIDKNLITEKDIDDWLLNFLKEIMSNQNQNETTEYNVMGILTSLLNKNLLSRYFSNEFIFDFLQNQMKSTSSFLRAINVSKFIDNLIKKDFITKDNIYLFSLLIKEGIDNKNQKVSSLFTSLKNQLIAKGLITEIDSGSK